MVSEDPGTYQGVPQPVVSVRKYWTCHSVPQPVVSDTHSDKLVPKTVVSEDPQTCKGGPSQWIVKTYIPVREYHSQWLLIHIPINQYQSQWSGRTHNPVREDPASGLWRPTYLSGSTTACPHPGPPPGTHPALPRSCSSPSAGPHSEGPGTLGHSWSWSGQEVPPASLWQ